MVHKDKNVRESATAWKTEIKAWFDKRYSDRKIFQLMQNVKSKTELLEDGKQRVVDLTLAIFRRNGVHLEEEEREKLVLLKSKITKLEYEFQNNLGEDTSTLLRTRMN